MKKAIVFDFDGTLVDTLPLVFHCFRRVLGKYGRDEHKNLTDADVLKLFGPTEVQILEAQVPPQSVVTATEEFLDLYERHHNAIVKHYPEIIAMLNSLSTEGYKLAVFTGKGRPTYEISVKLAGMAHFFVTSVTGDDVKHQKPDAEGLLAALQALGVTPEEAVMVGDSNGDVAAARSAGVDSVAVNWLSTSQTRHFTIEPTFSARNVQSFLDWLAHLNK